MDKGAKIVTIILGMFAVMLLGVYLFLTAVNKQIPRPVEYPVSGMSQSIFEAQNTKYTADSALTARHIFEHCPYTIDIIPADVAKVGEYGSVYKLSDAVYFYLTEFDKGANIDSILRSELPKAVMIDATSELTVIDQYVYEEGYLNGFKGDYYVDCITVTNGNRTSQVYLTGYVLTITDSALDHGYKMFVGAMTAENSTNSFANAKSMLDAIINTAQVDYDKQNALLKAEEDARLAEEQRMREAMENGETYVPPVSSESGNTSQDNLIVSTDGSTTDMAARAGEAQPEQSAQPGVPENEYIREDALINNRESAPDGQGGMGGAQIPQQKVKSMTIDQPYESVTLYYYYGNVENEITVVLENPDGTQTYTPQSAVPGTIIFKIDSMETGKWRLKIDGDAGTDSVKLYSEKMEEAESE